MTAGKIHLEFLLEGETDEVVLKALLPKMLPPAVTYTLHGLQGKDKLLKKLPERLRGYRAWLPPDWKIVILRDNDAEDCRKLKGYVTLQSSEEMKKYSKFHKRTCTFLRTMYNWSCGNNTGPEIHF